MLLYLPSWKWMLNTSWHQVVCWPAECSFGVGGCYPQPLDKWKRIVVHHDIKYITYWGNKYSGKINKKPTSLCLFILINAYYYYLLVLEANCGAVREDVKQRPIRCLHPYCSANQQSCQVFKCYEQESVNSLKLWCKSDLYRSGGNHWRLYVCL